MNLNSIWYRIKDFISEQRSRYTGDIVYRYEYDKPLRHPRDYKILLNNNLSWVYIATAKNSQEVAKAKLRLYVAKKPGKKIIARTRQVGIEQKLYLYGKANLSQFLNSAMDIEEITEHPALDLLKNVNGFANKFDLAEKTDLFQELTGNAYWYVVRNEMGVPVEIWVIPPDRMWVVPSREEFIAGYVYKFGSAIIPFDEDEIIHFKFPSATSPFYGDSPLFAVHSAYNILCSQQKYMGAVYGNMGAVQGLITTESSVTVTDFERLKKEWNAEYKGAEKAGKVAFFDKGLKYQEIGFTPADISKLDSKGEIKREILAAFGQPESLYSKEANRANAEAAIFIHKDGAIVPRLQRYDDKLNEKLIPMFIDETIFFAHDNPVPQDKEFKLKERTQNLAVGYTTRDEERMLEGKGTIGGNADVLLIPQGLIPIESAGQITGTEPTEGNAVVEEAIDMITQKVKERSLNAIG